MIRKQVYIHRRHQAILHRMARTSGVSEAEVLRQALGRSVGGAARGPIPGDPVAWEKALRLMEDLHAQGPSRNRARSWKREDAYQTRLSRRARNSR
jgi:hypothetical protein